MSETLWMARYRLPDGRWQHWAGFQQFQEAIEAMQFHAQDRDFEILAHTNYLQFQEAFRHLSAAIKKMEQSKSAFQSTTIAQARAEAEKAKEILENMI